MKTSNSSTSRSSKANLESQRRPTSAEKPTEEDSQKSLIAVIAKMSTVWMVSMILHVLLIVFLAVFTLAQVTNNDPISLAMEVVSDAEIETMTLDISPLELEETEALEVELEEVPLAEMEESFVEVELDTEFSESEMLAESEFEDLLEFTDMTKLDMAEEEAEEDEPLVDVPEPKFFKRSNNIRAATVVYIVDNSMSMVGKNPKSSSYGRMETALVELANSINNLDKSQRFYVLFYSDTAYGLFHPNTAQDYVAATPKNKQKFNAWLETVECCLKTKGSEAFEVARKLKPQLIYLLGDGAFGDRAHTKLVKKPIVGTIIETFGMGLSEADSIGFRDIAMAHGGNYHDIAVSPEGIALIKNFGPRKANRVPGPVWGIKLGDTPRMKKKKKKKKK